MAHPKRKMHRAYLVDGDLYYKGQLVIEGYAKA